MLGKTDPNRPFAAPNAQQISDDTKKVVRSAFESMANWRQDMATHYDQNSAQMFDKMGAAAKAMGWPAEIVDTTRSQMQAMSKMQLQAMDQVMDVWQQQLTSPNPAAAAQAMMSKLTQMPGMPGMPTMPGMPMMPGMNGMSGMPGMPSMPGFDMNQMAGMNPMQMWMQAAEQWQKNFANAMQYWSQMQKQTFEPQSSDPKRDPAKKSW
jgi:hypothetical protein